MPATTIDADGLVRHLIATQGPERRLVAIAGPPGSGKSTLAEALHRRIEALAPGLAQIVPMDGFHYDDIILNARGERGRKGAPFTFDVDGLFWALTRLKQGTEAVAVPVFDRSLEIARAGAAIIAPATRIILVEGNYLLLDDPHWARLRPLFDVTAMLRVPRAVLIDRLNQRWRDLGYAEADIRPKVDANDSINVDLVLNGSTPAQFEIDTAGALAG